MPALQAPRRALRQRPAATDEAPPDDAPLRVPSATARMNTLKQQMKLLLQAVEGLSQAHAQAAAVEEADYPDALDDAEDDEDYDEAFVADTPAALQQGPQPRCIPTLDLVAHIERCSLAWWDNHAAGTPIAYKDLQGLLSQAMGRDKNPRDKLKLQQIYTALTLAA